MLKDLTRDDWLGFLDLDPVRIPQSLILRGTRNLRTRYEVHNVLFDDVVEIGSPNGLFEDLFVGRRDGVDVGYASVYGPAVASEIAHVFGVLGTRLVIQTGVCGALGGGIEAGSLVVPDVAGSGDGASACYLPGIERVEATPSVVDRVAVADTDGVPLHDGPIWTTAALLAEGDAEICAWYDAGWCAVDMETAATFAVAEHYGMQRVSILTVFDNPRDGAQLAPAEAEKQAVRARGEQVAQRLVLDLAAAHG